MTERRKMVSAAVTRVGGGAMKCFRTTPLILWDVKVASAIFSL